MDRYKIIETISDQEYGIIAKAINIQTKQKCIIKILRKKFYTWQECLQVREVKALRQLQHQNIIKILELIKQRDELYCVYEYYEKSLFDYYQDMRDLCDELSERQIKEIMFQIVSAVHYIHDQKFFHRDLCPETISVSSSTPESYFQENIQVKLSSFTVTREISQRFTQYTDYITTRWYRAPEQLVHSINYTHKVDIWAIGCIMAELYIMGPIFNGISEQDQLLRIFKVFGTPTQQECPELYNYASQMKFTIPQNNPTNLSVLFPNASQNALDLMKQIFKYSPLQRPSCDSILKHPFFQDLNIQNLPLYNTPSNIIQKMSKKSNISDFSSSHKEQQEEEQAQLANDNNNNNDEHNTSADFQNSSKKSKFSQQNIVLNQDSINEKDSNFELQFSNIVRKHHEEEDDQVNLKFITSETNSNDNTTKNKEYTPQSNQ